MCMSVPQIAVLPISISTSLLPTLGSGTSSSQIPGAASFLTNAFNGCTSFYHSQLLAYRAECLDGLVELLAGERRRHLGADSGLTLRHHRERKADHVDAVLEEAIGHAAGEGGIAQHHGDDGVLARLQVETEARQAGTEIARILMKPGAQLR